MGVGVDEPRDDGAAAHVDDLCLIAAVTEDIHFAADGDEAPITDGDGPGERPALILGGDAAVQEDHVSGFGDSVAAAGRSTESATADGEGSDAGSADLEQLSSSQPAFVLRRHPALRPRLAEPTSLPPHFFAPSLAPNMVLA
jgi:hypothetical protein